MKQWTWAPPLESEEEEKKKQATWSWKPPEQKVETKEPIEEEPVEGIDKEVEGVNTKTGDVVNPKMTLDEPSWLDVSYHAGKAGLADVQSMALNLGRILYGAGVEVTDKVTDIFDEDFYSPDKDPIRKWLTDLVVESEKVAEDSYEKTVSKNRLKNLLAMGGRAVPLSLLSFASGGAIASAFPAIASTLGITGTTMLPFAGMSLGGHSRRIEQEYEARGKEAPYLAQLLGGMAGAAGEVATEAIPFQRWMNLYGGKRIMNIGAGRFLTKFGRQGVDWLTNTLFETGQEVAMVPIERALNNLLFQENEPLLPKDQLIRAGEGGIAMSVLLGGLGSTVGTIRSFTESSLEKVNKMELTTTDAAFDVAKEIVKETEKDEFKKEQSYEEIEKARICAKLGLNPDEYTFQVIPPGKKKYRVKSEEEAYEYYINNKAKEAEAEEAAIDAYMGNKKKSEKRVKETEKDDDKIKKNTLNKEQFTKKAAERGELSEDESNLVRQVEEEKKDMTPPDVGTKAGRLTNFVKYLFSSWNASLQMNPTAKNVQSAIEDWFGNKKESAYFADQVMHTFNDMVPSKANRELLSKWAENPEKYDAEVREKGLLEQGQWLQKMYAKAGNIAKAYGLVGDLIDNYSSHIYQNLDEYLKREKRKGSPATPIGGMFGTKFKHGLKRKLTFEQAEELGLKPVYDSSTLLGEYFLSLSKVIHNKNFIDSLKDMRDESGNPLHVKFDSKEPFAKGYRMVDSPAFAQYKYIPTKQKGKGILMKVPIRWHPEIAKAIEEISIPKAMQQSHVRALRKFKGIVKRVIFLNPMIHGWNIFSDVWDEVNFNIFEAFKSFGKGKKIFYNKPELVKEAVRNGLNLEHEGFVSEKLREEVYDILPMEGKGIISKGLGTLFRWNDRTLWIDIVRNSQLYIYNLKRQQGLSPKQAAVFTNDLLGTLPKHYFKNSEYVVTSSLFLARNWTMSNLRLLTGAMGTMSNVIPIKALQRPGLTDKQKAQMAPHYVKHLVKGMFGLIMMTNIFQKLLTGSWAWDNEGEHKLDVKLPWKDNSGRDMFIVMPLLRYMRDYIGWGTEPARTFWNKIEPVTKTSLELLINHSVWQNRQIRHPGAPITEQLRKMGEYALESWTPVDQIMNSERETKLPVQKMMYFTGTWIRRGATASSYAYSTLPKDEKQEFILSLNDKEVAEFYSQLPIGRFYGDVARKLWEFRNERNYKLEKVDNEIDRLLTAGDIDGAIQVMIESGRYNSIDGIEKRIMPYMAIQ